MRERAISGKSAPKIYRDYERQLKRLNGLQTAMQGKGFEDYGAAARLHERISAVEKRALHPRNPKLK